MHTTNLDLSLDEITKIEGTASLDLKIREGQVTECHFGIIEMRRFSRKQYAANPSPLSPIYWPVSAVHAPTPISLRASLPSKTV